MTRDEIDVMWQQALHQSVQDGEQFTRYRFAALVAAEHGKAKIRIGELECKLAMARGACKDIRRAIERECYAAAYIIVSEALAQIGGEDA